MLSADLKHRVYFVKDSEIKNEFGYLEKRLSVVLSRRATMQQKSSENEELHAGETLKKNMEISVRSCSKTKQIDTRNKIKHRCNLYTILSVDSLDEEFIAFDCEFDSVVDS